MAGNIVHAVATTNAIVGGLIVIEALKVLRDARRRRGANANGDGNGDAGPDADADPLPFRYTFVKQHKTNNRLLEPIEPDPPNAKCAVCGGARMELVCDADAFTLGRLVDDVLMKKLGMCAPEIEAPETTLFLQPDDLDEDEAAMYARNRTTALRHLPAGGVGGGTELDVSDFSQKFDFKLLVTHRPADEWDEETDPDGFILRGDESAIGDGAAEGAEGGDANGAGDDDEDDDDVCIVDDEVEPVAATDGKRRGTTRPTRRHRPRLRRRAWCETRETTGRRGRTVDDDACPGGRRFEPRERETRDARRRRRVAYILMFILRDYAAVVVAHHHERVPSAVPRHAHGVVDVQVIEPSLTHGSGMVRSNSRRSSRRAASKTKLTRTSPSTVTVLSTAKVLPLQNTTAFCSVRALTSMRW